MTAVIDVHGRPKRALVVVSNPSTSTQTGWPIGFWWAELSHPYWEFVEHGYAVTIASPDGTLLVDGKTWTGFANREEDYADAFVGQAIQPFRIEDEARAIPGTNFIVDSAFTAHAIRDGNLITGQQQYSGAAAARLVIRALGQ